MNHSGAIAAALRAAWPAALARLVRITGSLADAEDFLQDAATAALERWPREGLPEAPAAWLVATGRNRYLDALRHRKIMAEHAHLVAEPAFHEPDPIEAAENSVFAHDDLLRLIFTCCHPGLPEAARLVLTLRAIAGLSVAEIGRALLIEERAAEQRLTRAKRLVEELGLPYAVPGEEELPARRETVLRVAYLIFNEGYKASSGEALIRFELCRVAIGLARTLCRLFPAEPEVHGLLALMLLAHARSSARYTHTGEIVLLDRQDRSLWDREAIAEGQALIEKAMRHRRPGSYQVQAAIAALHCEAASVEETDWAQIALLYETLERLQASPVVRLNRAVALAKAQGPEAGLALLESIADRREIRDYAEFHGARAALLERLGRAAEAAISYRRARELTQHAPTARHLEERIEAMSGVMSGLGAFDRQ